MDSLRITLIVIGACFIALIYLWERFRRRRQHNRYARWGGLDDDGSETRVVSQPVTDSPEDDHSDYDDDIRAAVADIDSFTEMDDNPLPEESPQPDLHSDPDFDSDPEANVDPIPDIRSELEALEEIIASDDRQPAQFEIGDLDIRTDSRDDTGISPDTSHDPDRVIALNIIAHSGQSFSGSDLLYNFMQADLQYGEMNIFHKLADDGTSPIFSLANAVEPGVFDIADMENVSTPALLLFMTVPSRINSLQAFDSMLETATNLAEALHGKLCDDTRSALTQQGIEVIRSSLG